MSDPGKYTANIARKGLDATGVTEEHVRAMASGLGGHTMMIVEAEHLNVRTDAEGKVQVVLRLSSVEPVPAHLDEQVREFQRALYRRRPEVQGQEALSGIGGGQSADDAARALDPGAWDADPDAPDEPQAETEDAPSNVAAFSASKGKRG